MTDLVASLSSGPGTWIQVMKVIDSPSWNNVFLIAPTFFASKFQNVKKNVTVITIDDTKDISLLIDDIHAALVSKLGSDMEVGLNFASGSGKEHMAILAALLKMGKGIRFVAHTEKGIVEL